MFCRELFELSKKMADLLAQKQDDVEYVERIVYESKIINVRYLSLKSLKKKSINKKKITGKM